MDDPSYRVQLTSIGCMVQSLTDQFAAYQRDHPVNSFRPRTTNLPDDSSRAMLIEVVTVVRRLQADLQDLRAELRTGIRTQSLIVEDDAHQVSITPGEIIVERHAGPGEIHTGSFVHIQALIRGAEVQVGAAAHRRDDPGVSALINANWEGTNPTATVGAYAAPDDHPDSSHELRVEDQSERGPSPTTPPSACRTAPLPPRSHGHVDGSAA